MSRTLLAVAAIVAASLPLTSVSLAEMSAFFQTGISAVPACAPVGATAVASLNPRAVA
jgi:hypothetical protein